MSHVEPGLQSAAFKTRPTAGKVGVGLIVTVHNHVARLTPCYIVSRYIHRKVTNYLDKAEAVWQSALTVTTKTIK